jgi:hypothetical protein
VEATRPLTILRRYAVRVRSLLIDLIKPLGVLGAMGIIPDQGIGAHYGSEGRYYASITAAFFRSIWATWSSDNFVLPQQMVRG